MLHSLARYLETSVILEALGVAKLSFALVTGDPGILWDARRNGRKGLARRDASVLFSSSTALVTCTAQVPLSDRCSQVRDGVKMVPVIQQVEPLGCGNLTVKHDAVAAKARIHHYPVV
jgi:hypothetical protein